MAKKRRRKRKHTISNIQLTDKEKEAASIKDKRWSGSSKITLPPIVEEPAPPLFRRNGLHIYKCSICKAESSIVISLEELNDFIIWHKKISPSCCPEITKEEDAITSRETIRVEPKSIQGTSGKYNESNEVLSGQPPQTKRKRGRPRKNPIPDVIP